MGLGEIAKLAAEEFSGYAFIRKEENRCYEEFFNFLNKTKEELKIVESNPGQGICKAMGDIESLFRRVLKRGKISLLTNLNINNFKTAQKHFLDNYSWLTYLKNEHGNNLSVWWTPKKLKRDYIVSDCKRVLLEENFGVRILYKGKKIAPEYSKNFDELIQNERVVKLL